MKPTLAGVLAAIQPGNTLRLALTPEQKQTLKDPDARLALQVVRHLGARAASIQRRTAGETFPLTEAPEAAEAFARRVQQHFVRYAMRSFVRSLAKDAARARARGSNVRLFLDARALDAVVEVLVEADAAVLVEAREKLYEAAKRQVRPTRAKPREPREHPLANVKAETRKKRVRHITGRPLPPR